MDFKRHHQQQGFAAFNSRLNNPSNSGHGGYQQHQHQGGFVNHHVPHSHNSRQYKPSEGHNHSHTSTNVNGRGLSLTHSFRNLLKMQAEMVLERTTCFQKLSQLRDLMLTRINHIANNILEDEFLEALIAQIIGMVLESQNPCSTSGDGDSIGGEEVAVAAVEEASQTEEEPVAIPLILPPAQTVAPPDEGSKSKTPTSSVEDFKIRIKGQIHTALTNVVEETRIYALREDNFTSTIFSKERRVEKDFLEFFNEAERQIIEYEKKFRNDQYSQILSRLRAAEREIALRDQKIMQLEDTVKLVGDRCEKLMAELQQLNADHQFEKLQLYHHVEVCKYNAKCMAMEELLRICKWKRCGCGRDYDDVWREFEMNFNSAYSTGGTSHQDCFGAAGRFKEVPDRREMSCTAHSSWAFPTGQTQAVQSQPIPAGSFIPSEEAATKGMVQNDLRDRYDELQLKAAVLPNYEEIRNMIMKIVCHFKAGGFRVCEEMRGKQYVSSLFYCNTEDLVPNKTDKIFSLGYGDTPEEATHKSVKRAFDEIQRIETMNVTTAADRGIDMTFVRRNPLDTIMEKLDNESIRMTLLRSYCNEKVNEESSSSAPLANVRCLQEAHLYQNHANAEERYMADWKIHIRVEDSQEKGIKGKLMDILSKIKDSHVSDFVDNRPQKEKVR